MWLPKEIVLEHMPKDFREKYPETRVILDATECFIQKPGRVQDQAATWSSYKNHNTLKAMIGISPRGQVTYVSDAYGGATSDRQIIERSCLLDANKFERKDSIMSDRGIRVQDLFASKDVFVNTPTTMRGKNQLPAKTVLNDRRIASKRVHVERVIGFAKYYKILKHEMDKSYSVLGSRIIYVCFMICNFRHCLLNANA